MHDPTATIRTTGKRSSFLWGSIILPLGSDEERQKNKTPSTSLCLVSTSTLLIKSAVQHYNCSQRKQILSQLLHREFLNHGYNIFRRLQPLLKLTKYSVEEKDHKSHIQLTRRISNWLKNIHYKNVIYTEDIFLSASVHIFHLHDLTNTETWVIPSTDLDKSVLNHFGKFILTCIDVNFWGWFLGEKPFKRSWCSWRSLPK